MNNKKRDYQKELAADKKNIKRYTVKVPLYIAKALDEKLKQNNMTYSKMALEAIEKYIKKS